MNTKSFRNQLGILILTLIFTTIMSQIVETRTMILTWGYAAIATILALVWLYIKFLRKL